MLSALAMGALLPACGQSDSERSAVRLAVEVDSLQPALTLIWEPVTGASGHLVWRRAPGSTTWGAPVATLGGGATQWSDNGVLVGLDYEYKVERTGIAGFGYVRAGISVPPVEDRGSLVLLVDSTLGAALGAAVVDLERDLLSDGWWVYRRDVSSATPVDSVRALVQQVGDDDPDLRMVYVLGHVPVPYSGNLNPDGHNEHRGAWACDAYYADLDGVWTDDTVAVTTASFPWNHNVPGDGKLDQSDLPTPSELAIGRVDLSDLPSFQENELQLTQAYLDRAHAWKTVQFSVPASAVIFDHLQWTAYPLAQSAHMGFAACVGPANVTEIHPSNGPFSSHLIGGEFLWTFQGGAGLQGTGTANQVTFIGTTNGVLTQDVAQGPAGGVFNLSFGSYFGDWDNEDNYLRALLGSGNSLVHAWSGIPNWFVYPMALGEPIGYCMRRSVNNTVQDHAPQNAGWQGQEMGRVHMALMGDPTLRQDQVAPPSDLIVGPSGWYTGFSWSPSTEQVEGYLIHRIDTVAGGFERMSPQLISDTFFVLPELYTPGERYLVRAVKLIVANTGTYHALSLGALAEAQGQAVPDCNGVPGGPAIAGTPCDDGNFQTIDDIFDAQCDCMGTLSVGMTGNGSGGIHVAQLPGRAELWLRADRALDEVWQVFDAHGSRVGQGLAVGHAPRIGLQGLSPGVYVLVLSGPSGRVLSHRFVVSH